MKFSKIDYLAIVLGGVLFFVLMQLGLTLVPLSTEIMLDRAWSYTTGGLAMRFWMGMTYK